MSIKTEGLQSMDDEGLILALVREYFVFALEHLVGADGYLIDADAVEALFDSRHEEAEKAVNLAREVMLEEPDADVVESVLLKRLADRNRVLAAAPALRDALIGMLREHGRIIADADAERLRMRPVPVGVAAREALADALVGPDADPETRRAAVDAALEG